MVCSSYKNLNSLEKRKFIGELTTVIQSNEELFLKAVALIREGQVKGILDKVKVMPYASETKSVLQLSEA